MSLPLSLLRTLQSAAATEAWTAVFEYAWGICSKPISDKAKPEITARDRAVGTIDFFLATAGWDLWSAYEDAVPRTSDALAKWWAAQGTARAILILDGLSLREAPWLLQGANERGYTIHQARPTGAELPAETTPFANALGLSSRSALGNDSAPATHRLVGARTDTVSLPWQDCVDLITAHPSWVLWHHWPDKRVHDLDGHGQGIDLLTEEAAEMLRGDAFWMLVERMATGRRLVITADHGYAASGRFPDVADSDQVKYLKAQFRAGRYADDDGEQSAWVPPIDLVIESQHGRHRFVNGQRKWKAQGGYPTLTHGGLSVLEVAVPFIEISKQMGR